MDGLRGLFTFYSELSEMYIYLVIIDTEFNMKEVKSGKRHYDFYKVWGKYFGYPTCCINEFLNFSHQHPDKYYGETVNRIKFRGTGYIPCAVRHSKSENEILSLLNSNRICKVAFPHEDVCEVSVDNILKSKLFSNKEKRIIYIHYLDNT